MCKIYGFRAIYLLCKENRLIRNNIINNYLYGVSVEKEEGHENDEGIMWVGY